MRSTGVSIVGHSVLLLLMITSSLAQTECAESPDMPQASRLACEQIKDSIEKYRRQEAQINAQVRKVFQTLPRRTLEIEGKRFDGVPMQNPLDAANGNEGGKAWEEFSHDSKLALHPETVMGCMEPRLVPSGQYEAMCQQICPQFVRVENACIPCVPGTPGCRQQTHMAIEYYLPMYQLATNKAGSRSIDVTMFSGYDNDPKLTRSGTGAHLETEVRQSVERSLDRLLGPERAKTAWPSYHKPGNELFLQGNNETFDLGQGAESYPISYQTLLHAHASRDRPVEFFKGWAEEPKSALWCFGKPEKRVIGNAMDHGDGVYSTLSRMAEFTATVWPEAYQATVKLPWKLRQAGRIDDLPEGLAPSYRMTRWSDPFRELARVGVRPGASAQSRDWIFYGGELAPFNVDRFNSYTDPVRADLFRMSTAALLFNSQRGSLRTANQELFRFPQFTRYAGRSDGGRPGYTNTNAGVKDSIQFVDKVQLAYPPLEDGDPRKGSECFRIENLANNEAGTDKDIRRTENGHIALPKDLRAQFLARGISELNRANETRMIVWTKRVMCACELCGIPYGCTTLNHGDFEEDSFAGTIGFPTPPPPLQEVLPFLNGYARNTSPPPVKPAVVELFDIPANDSGTPGPLPGVALAPIAAQPSPPSSPPPQIPPPPLQVLACLLGNERQLSRSGSELKVAVFQYLPEQEQQSSANARLVATAGDCGKSGCRSIAYTRMQRRSGQAAPRAHCTQHRDGTRCSLVARKTGRENPLRNASSKIDLNILGAGGTNIGPNFGGGCAGGSCGVPLGGVVGSYNGAALNFVSSTSVVNTFGQLNGAIGAATAHLPGVGAEVSTAIAQAQNSLSQLGFNTIGAGSADVIKSAQTQLAEVRNILHQHGVHLDQQTRDLLHQAEQELEQLERQEDERKDEEQEEERPNNNQQNCAQGGGQQLAQAIQQALQGLLQGLGQGGGGGQSTPPSVDSASPSPELENDDTSAGSAPSQSEDNSENEAAEEEEKEQDEVPLQGRPAVVAKQRVQYDF